MYFECFFLGSLDHIQLLIRFCNSLLIKMEMTRSLFLLYHHHRRRRRRHFSLIKSYVLKNILNNCFFFFCFFFQVKVLGAEKLLESVPNRDPRKNNTIVASPDNKFRLSKRMSTTTYHNSKTTDSDTFSSKLNFLPCMFYYETCVYIYFSKENKD